MSSILIVCVLAR